MIGPEEIFDMFFDNIKQLFFPENWLQLDLKFSKTEVFSMFLIAQRHEITMTELSEYINTPMSTANGIIERLVKKGLILRDRSDADRRIVVLRLSDEGAKLVEGFKDLITGYLKMALEALTEDEVQAALVIVMKIMGSLQNKLSNSNETVNQTVKKIAIE